MRKKERKMDAVDTVLASEGIDLFANFNVRPV